MVEIALLLYKKGQSLNGWLQLKLRIYSIPLEKGTESVCFKETKYSSDHCKKWLPEVMTVPLKCMAASEIIRLK